MRSEPHPTQLPLAQEVRNPAQLDPIERSKEAWVVALAEAVFEQTPNLQSIGSSESIARTPHIANEGAQAKPATAASTTNATKPQPEHSVLSTVVQAGSLGEVGVEVTRSPAGLQLVIKVAATDVKELFEGELPTLLQSLGKAGLSTTSVRIEAPMRDGTTLAVSQRRPRVNAGRQPPATPRSYRTAMPNDDEVEGGDGLNLTV